MKVKEVIDLISYGTHWQLIGAMTGKKLCNSYSSENLKSKYMDCSVCKAPIFASFNIHTTQVTYACLLNKVLMNCHGSRVLKTN